MNKHGTCKQCGGPLPEWAVQESVCDRCVDKHLRTIAKMHYKSARWMHLSSAMSAVLVIGLLGGFANTAKSIEVTPPSPVPALSPTVIRVKCNVEEGKLTFIMVLGIVDGDFYSPAKQMVGPGELTFSGPPGKYMVSGIEANVQFENTVVVEGDDSPDPPPPVPPPPGVRSTIIIRESSEDDPQLALAAQKLQEYQQKKGRYNRYLDDDSKAPDGKLLKWVQDLLVQAKAANIKMPFLVIGDGSDGVGKVIKIVAMPTESGAAVSLLKKHGG